ncbi:hypothetical protein Hanom_Chr04g00312761 [Helianthus anomalus]
MYTPKRFYTKALFITLRVEKFGGTDAPSRPKEVAPLAGKPLYVGHMGLCGGLRGV